jgi:hypothetical protein
MASLTHAERMMIHFLANCERWIRIKVLSQQKEVRNILGVADGDIMKYRLQKVGLKRLVY